MRKRVFIAPLVAMLFVGGVAPTGAEAAWTPPQTLSAAGQNANSARVAIDNQGDAVFVWRRFDGTNWRIQARARSATGALSPIQSLSAGGRNAARPQIDVDADGDAAFTWERYDGAKWRIESRSRSAAGVLSSVQTLSAAGQNAYFPQVAVDADGDAVFTWQRFDGARDRIQARARSAGGALSQVQTLSAAGKNARKPQVGIAPNGKAVFVWQRFFPTSPQRCCMRIEARARSFNGTLSTVQTLSPPPSPGQLDAVTPQVGVDADGDAVLAWILNETDGSHDFTTTQARTRSAAGALGPVQAIRPGAYEFQLAVNGGGNAVFAMRCCDYGGPYLQVRTRSAAGVLSPVKTLANSYDGSSPQVGIDGTGNAVVTWEGWESWESTSVRAQVRSSAGTLGPLQTLSATGSGPQVAVNGVGHAVATWQNSDGANSVIRAAAGP